MAGPGNFGRRKNGAIGADLDGGVFIVDGQNQAGDVASLFDGMTPVFVFVGVEFAEIVFQDVGELVAPAVAAIVGVQAIANGLIGGFLHLDIQRGVNAQAAFVNRFGAVGGFEILANVFEEVRREIVARVLDMQAERSFLGGGFIGGGDFAFFFHAVKNQIAAREAPAGLLMGENFGPLTMPASSAAS